MYPLTPWVAIPLWTFCMLGWFITMYPDVGGLLRRRPKQIPREEMLRRTALAEHECDMTHISDEVRNACLHVECKRASVIKPVFQVPRVQVPWYDKNIEVHRIYDGVGGLVRIIKTQDHLDEYEAQLIREAFL